jgi:hypothetical protein
MRVMKIVAILGPAGIAVGLYVVNGDSISLKSFEAKLNCAVEFGCAAAEVCSIVVLQ